MTRNLLLILAALAGAVSCSDSPPLTPRPVPGGPNGVWTSMNRIPVVQGLNDVTGASDGSILAGGSRGSTLFYDGARWSVLETCGGTELNSISSVWAGAPGDFYLAGGGALLRFDGTSCEQVDTGWNHYYYFVWGTSPADAYAAGVGGAVVHFDGAQWSDISLPDVVTVTGVWGMWPDVVYAISSNGQLYRLDGGGDWTPVTYAPDPPADPPRYIAGASPDNILLSGYDTYFFDGSSWRRIPPVITGRTQRVNDLFAVGDNDYYAAESHSLLHFDGVAWRALWWTEVATIEGCWVEPGGDVIAVGEPAGVWRYSGGEMTLLNETTNRIRDVWGSAPDDVYAVGDNGTILHYDGVSWTAMESDAIGPWQFTSVSGGGPGDVHAVSYYRAYHFDGQDWSRDDFDFDSDLRDIHAFATGDLFVVGRKGITRYDGAAWSKSQISADLQAVWGSSPSNVYAVGDVNVLHFNGREWTIEETGIDFYARDVWGRSEREVYVAGDGGVFVFDGYEWRRWEEAGTVPVVRVWCPPAGPDVFLVDSWNRNIRHFDGKRWGETGIADVVGFMFGVYAIWGTSAYDVFAAGDRGMLLHYGPAP